MYRDALPTANGFVYGDKIVPTFQESLYGFKPHAIELARKQRYKKVIWLDPSVLPLVSLKCIYDMLDEYPVITRGGAHELSEMTNSRAKSWFGVSDIELSGVKHIAGTVYAFNFESTEANKVFDLWMSAEQSGIFGTQDDFMRGHWADESCMALAMYKCKVPQVWCHEFNFQNQKEL
jgi:hypothetical protein